MTRILEFISNHALLVTGFLVVSVLLFQDIIESATRKHKKISALTAVKLINDSEALVIDVRDSNEFKDGHITGATNIPLGQLSAQMESLRSHLEKPLIVVCASGTRAPEACKKLTGTGHTQVYEISGGMLAWGDQKLPTSKSKSR